MKNCQRFESRLSEYLEHALLAEAERECSEHLLSCVECRTLLRDVENAVKTLHEMAPSELPASIEERVLAIGRQENALTCSEFEDRITEFLDDFVEAPVFHAFQDHAHACLKCSDTLNETVLAVAACHSVHFEESRDIPERVIENILASTSVARQRRKERWSWWERWSAAAREFFRPVLTPQWAAGFAIIGASMMVLVFSVSDDGSLQGVARGTNNYATKVFSQSQSWTTGKNLAIGDLKKISSWFAAIWKKPAPTSGSDTPSAPPSAGQGTDEETNAARTQAPSSPEKEPPPPTQDRQKRKKAGDRK